MLSCCPIPFKHIYIDKDTQFPIVYIVRGHSPMCFSIDYLQKRKRYLVEGIYSNIEFRNKAVRFCYA